MKSLRSNWAAKVMFVVMMTWGLALHAQTPQDSISRGRTALEQGDTQKALSEILNLLQRQQQSIDLLMQRSQDQQRVIEQQRQLIETQNQDIQRQKEQLDQQQRQLAEAPRMPDGFADNYSADRQYATAYNLQRIAIFEVRRRDAPPYFERAIVEFRKVVEDYPNSDKADDAQFRIARIYHRYLRDFPKARQEYQYLIDHYPDSEYVTDAREALNELR